MRSKYTAEEKQKLVEQYRQGNLTLQGFAAENGIKAETFKSWVYANNQDENKSKKSRKGRKSVSSINNLAKKRIVIDLLVQIENRFLTVEISDKKEINLPPNHKLQNQALRPNYSELLKDNSYRKRGSSALISSSRKRTCQFIQVFFNILVQNIAFCFHCCTAVQYTLFCNFTKPLFCQCNFFIIYQMSVLIRNRFF